jgi:MFS family permease
LLALGFGQDHCANNCSQNMPNFLYRFGQMNSDGTFYFSNVRSGLIVSLLSIGTLMGALIAGPVADLIGRKWSISAWCLMLHLGLIVQISSAQGKWYQSKPLAAPRFVASQQVLTGFLSRHRSMDCWSGRRRSVSACADVPERERA